MDAARRRMFRLQVARRDAPTILQWGFAVYATVSLLGVLLRTNTGFDLTVDALVLAALGITFMVVRSPRTGLRWYPWLIANACVTEVLGLSVQYHVDHRLPGTNYAYVVLVMAATGVLTLEYLPTISTGVAFVIAYFMFAPDWAPQERHAWALLSCATLAASLVLLRVRHLGIDELGEMSERVREFALRDQLTDMLNRRGTSEHAQPLLALAARSGQSVFAMFVDVDGLKQANDRFGHEFGDQVIVAVALAIRQCVREADIVGRWGGDEFVVIGVGEPWPPEVIRERIVRAIDASGLDVSRWKASVSVGIATMPGGGCDIDELLARADGDMYARRAARRGG